MFILLFVVFSEACKGEDLGKVEFDEEIKKRFKMVYVPNWFSVDLKTGVSFCCCCFISFDLYYLSQLTQLVNASDNNNNMICHSFCYYFLFISIRCSQLLWMRAIALLLGCLQRTLGFQVLMALIQSVRNLSLY